MIADGATHSQIAAALVRRSTYAVGNRAARLGLSNPEASKRNAVEAMRASWADKSTRGATVRKIKASWTPERRARQAECARRTTAEHPYRPPSPEGRARITEAVKAHFRQRKAWIPEDLRREYTRLVRNIGADRAREKIKAIIADRSASMTPFERSMARVRAGAGITEVWPLRPVEAPYSLTGSSMAMVTYG